MARADARGLNPDVEMMIISVYDKEESEEEDDMFAEIRPEEERKRRAQNTSDSPNYDEDYIESRPGTSVSKASGFSAGGNSGENKINMGIKKSLGPSRPGSVGSRSMTPVVPKGYKVLR